MRHLCIIVSLALDLDLFFLMFMIFTALDLRKKRPKSVGYYWLQGFFKIELGQLWKKIFFSENLYRDVP